MYIIKGIYQAALQGGIGSATMSVMTERPRIQQLSNAQDQMLAGMWGRWEQADKTNWTSAEGEVL